MVKTININVSYNNQRQIFACSKQEFADKIKNYFNIDICNVILYDVSKKSRREIAPSDITDLMRILMIDKADAQKRTLRSIFENDSTRTKSFANIVTKLRQNSPLSGSERKALIEFLEQQSSTPPQKRKIGELDDDVAQPQVHHKKVQVDFSFNLKDSFAQTDPCNVEWDQVNGDVDESSEEENVIITMKKLAHSGKTVGKREVAKLMKKSFVERRNLIFIKSPTVLVVRDEYPLLFSIDEVKNELERIFYPGKCAEFLNNMEMYASHILKSHTCTDDIVIRTQKSVERAQTPAQVKYAKIVGSVFVLSRLLGEEFQFIHLEETAHSSADLYPYIDASISSLKEVFFDSILYPIIVEGQHLCEASNLPEAILCLIACFFIFNISYPTECHRTLTVFEKFYLCANDTKDVDERTEQIIKLIQLKVKDSQSTRSER